MSPKRVRSEKQLESARFKSVRLEGVRARLQNVGLESARARLENVKARLGT